MKATLHSAGTTLAIDYRQEGEEYIATIDGQSLRARLLSLRDDVLTLLVNEKPLQAHVASEGERILVAIAGRVYEFAQEQEKSDKTRRRESGRLDPEVRSPMPGKILQVLVEEGALVEDGQTLVLLEAMKMENSLTAEGAARVKKIHVSPGDLVDLGQVIVELEFTGEAAAMDQDS
jgi:biotin carboxyl carrier protein